MPLSDNLINAWRFNGNTDDEGSANYDGTLQSTAAISGGRLVVGTNSDDRMSVTEFTLSADWSIAFNGKQDSSGTRGVLAGDYSTNTSFIFFHGGTALKVQIGATSHEYTTLTSFTTDADYLIVYDATADTLTLYKDGSLVATKTSVTSGSFTIETIGHGINAGFGLIGSLDYFYVWDRTLDSTEASTLAADPDAPFGAVTPLAPPFLRRRTRFFTGR